MSLGFGFLPTSFVSDEEIQKLKREVTDILSSVMALRGFAPEVATVSEVRYSVASATEHPLMVANLRRGGSKVPVVGNSDGFCRMLSNGYASL